jgi:hypothetical protein
MAAFNDQAADDFVLFELFDYVIHTVNLMGEYSAGGGPASSFNVFFYTKAEQPAGDADRRASQPAIQRTPP